MNPLARLTHRLRRPHTPAQADSMRRHPSAWTDSFHTTLPGLTDADRRCLLAGWTDSDTLDYRIECGKRRAR